MDDLQGNSVLIAAGEADEEDLARIFAAAGLRPFSVFEAADEPPALIVLDAHRFAVETVAWLHDEQLRQVPTIYICASEHPRDKVAAFDAGATDCISKPFHEREVLARVTNCLRLRRQQVERTWQNSQPGMAESRVNPKGCAQDARNSFHLEQQISEAVEELTASQLATIFALAKLTEARQQTIGAHHEAVQRLSRLLALQMRKSKSHVLQLTDEFIETLYQSASLHDIGKVGVPDAILLKRGELTAEEFEQMKSHTLLGARTLSRVLREHPSNPLLCMGVDLARSHHEQWDGNGYPDGLQGEAIPLAARIVAVADFYDAMTSNRCYRLAYTHEEVCQLIREGSGSHFDPDVAGAFEAIEAEVRLVGEALQLL